MILQSGDQNTPPQQPQKNQMILSPYFPEDAIHFKLHKLPGFFLLLGSLCEFPLGELDEFPGPNLQGNLKSLVFKLFSTYNMTS